MQQPDRTEISIPAGQQQLEEILRAADVVIGITMPDRRPLLLWGLDNITTLADPRVARFIVPNARARTRLERAVEQVKKMECADTQPMADSATR